MFRKQLRNLIRWAQRYDSNSISLDSASPIATSKLASSGIHFTLYSAAGGHIVEYKGDHNNLGDRVINLHIIHRDEDVAERIGQIVTLELLRN